MTHAKATSGELIKISIIFTMLLIKKEIILENTTYFDRTFDWKYISTTLNDWNIVALAMINTNKFVYLSFEVK